MLRMEIALFLVLAFVAGIYFSAGRRHTPLHRTFSLLLLVMLVHLALDGATIYTVNHLDAVPPLLNAVLHRLFIGTMVCAIYLFYQYIAILMQEETGKPRGSTSQRGSFWCWRCSARFCCRSRTSRRRRAAIPRGLTLW